MMKKVVLNSCLYKSGIPFMERYAIDSVFEIVTLSFSVIKGENAILNFYITGRILFSILSLLDDIEAGIDGYWRVKRFSDLMAGQNFVHCLCKKHLS